MGDLIGVFAELLEGIGSSPLGQIILGVIAGLILLEVMGLLEFAALQLLRIGTKLLPPAFRKRYIEENEAVIRSVSGPFAKVVCMASAVIGAIHMRLSLGREEIDILERKSHGEKISLLRGDTDFWFHYHSNIEKILAELIKNSFQRDLVFRSLMSPLINDPLEIPLDEKEFYEMVKNLVQRQNRYD